MRRDKTALEKIYGREAPWLLRAAYRIVCQLDIADDVIQDAFIQIWHEAQSFRPQPQFGGLDLERCCNRVLKRALAYIYSDDCNCAWRCEVQRAPSLDKPPHGLRALGAGSGRSIRIRVDCTTSSFAPFLVTERTSCNHKPFAFGSAGNAFAVPPIAGKVRE
jgi:Sigma-70 region 2